MNNKIKMIVAVVGVICVVIAGVLYNKSNEAQSQAIAKEFCDSVQPGKNVTEVMELIGASSFEKLVFSNSQGQVVNAANKGTFSPSKSAGFTGGVILVSFESSRCEIDVKEGVVTNKALRVS